MLCVYRITSLKYAEGLKASGIAARWNRERQMVIYTAESRSLACLENLVHRSKRGLNSLFKIMVVEIPDELKIEMIEPGSLSQGWESPLQLNVCQEIGTHWYSSGRSPVLKVPSALVPKESNFVIHTLHQDFKNIHIVDLEDFYFDSRFL